MKRMSACLGFAAALVTLCCQGAEVEIHYATRLGNPATRFAPPLATPEDLRNLFRDDRLKPDIASILQQWGWQGNLDDLYRAAATAEIADISIPVGTTMPFMSSRKDGKPVCLRNVVWLGREPAPAFAFDFTSNQRNYRCVTPKACSNFFLQDRGAIPVMGIQKTGPATAQVGQDVTYDIVVSNTGGSTVENVVVTDAIPAGMSHTSGQNTLAFNVGNIEPGKSRQIPVTLKALRRGSFTNRVVAESSNASKVAGEAPTVVTQPALQIQKTGTKEQYIDRKATYDIVVSNPGDAPLSDVVVTDTVPQGHRILSAEGAAVAGNTATWRLANLGPGENQTLRLALTSPVAGTFTNHATAAAGELSVHASADTRWRGYAGLLLQMIDTVDPVEIGQTTEYVVTITNQGSAPDTNIKAVMEIPPEMELVSVTGATPGHVEGRIITFDAYPQLNPKQAIQWTIKVKAVKAADARSTARYTSDLIRTPVAKEESTHTY
ncbi:MAG: DUF11 domain-containing protein [Verrucomicrobiae bacterium]|nr:DUF11 domain-containing protein [Verrucomicrobiae bacterium]